jgi:hypothetical protein
MINETVRYQVKGGEDRPGFTDAGTESTSYLPFLQSSKENVLSQDIY